MCTKQLNDYNDGFDSFNELDAQVLGISPQDLDSHERFSSKYGFKFPLLADTDKAVARRYGTLGPIGFPRRSVFIVDGDGIVRYAHRAIAGLTFRPASELVAVLQDSASRPAHADRSPRRSDGRTLDSGGDPPRADRRRYSANLCSPSRATGSSGSTPG